jgi:hypothetical protein
VLAYDTTVGWECTTCASAWPTVAGLLAHLHLPQHGQVDRLQAGNATKGIPPVFTGPVDPPVRAFSVRAVNPAVLKGRLTLLARGVRSATKVHAPQLTIAPRW